MKTIIFDFDGTIADSFLVVKNIVLNLSKDFGYKKPTEKEILQLKTKHPKEVMNTLGISYYKLPILLLRAKLEMHKQILNIRPIEGIENTLHSLKSKKYMLGIVTSNNKKNVIAFLKKNNLDLFDFIQTESNIFGKSRALNQVVKKQKLDKKNVIYVGDEIRDIEAAKETGIKMVAVAWGFNDKAGLQKFHPDILINKPNELLSLVKNLDTVKS